MSEREPSDEHGPGPEDGEPAPGTPDEDGRARGRHLEATGPKGAGPGRGAAGADMDRETRVNDVTVAAVGTSITWSTGNAYEHKFPDLVHRDLNGNYPLDEKFLHYDQGGGGPGGGSDPVPEYYTKTTASYGGADHPRGPHIPPSQYRARGGAIIGLSPPAKVAFGKKSMSEITHNDNGGYFHDDADGSYYGKVKDGDFQRLVGSYFKSDDINRSAWLITRDIGWSWPTIVDQMEQFPHRQDAPNTVDVPKGTPRQFSAGQLTPNPPVAEDVDLLILDGGTNDMQLGWLNNPTKARRHKIWKADRLYQYRNFTGNGMANERGLLKRARDRFPNAVIVVVGAPVWASNRTDYRRAAAFLEAKKPISKIAPDKVAESAIDNALNFSHFSPYWLRRAVAEEARTDPGPGIVFAPPGYGIVNAMMADWPWSYGYTPTGKRTGYSPDDVHKLRGKVCDTLWRHEQLTEGDGNEEIGSEKANVKCTAASIGHPNNEGCRQYADTILRRYKEYIDLPVGSIAGQLDDGTDSLRESLGRYRFDSGTDGVRWPMSHRYVDSIRVRITTGAGSGQGQKQGEVYLTVYPGRTGTGERFRLDTELNNHRPDGPKTTVDHPYVRPKDEYYIVPTMDRWLDGPVGNTDLREDRSLPFKRNETNRQTYRPNETTRRLRLSDVEHVTLETINVDGGDGWDIEDVDVSINGTVDRNRRFTFFDNKDVRSGNDRKWMDREFLLTSFNHVDGVGPGDFRLEVLDGTIAFSKSSDGATLSYDVLVRNDSTERVPNVAIQYGLRAKNIGGTYTGRNWQVARLGDFDPGQARRPRVTVGTDKAGHIKTNNDLRLYAILCVDGAFERDYAQTNKKRI